MNAISWAMLGADTRRWAFYNIGARMGRIDTGVMHGPITRGQHYLGAVYFPNGPKS